VQRILTKSGLNTIRAEAIHPFFRSLNLLSMVFQLISKYIF